VDPLTYRTIAVHGIELQVSVTGEGGGRGLAMLLHGFPESAFSWRYQIPALVEAGYEVWAPNSRGYGGSSKPPKVSDYSMDRLLADVAALIDASGRSDVMLVGHDWGAAQAWMFAIRRVRPLQRLVIMNVPHPACMRRELRRPASSSSPGTSSSSRSRGCPSSCSPRAVREWSAMRSRGRRSIVHGSPIR
jgi:epoxide hydrolase 4